MGRYLDQADIQKAVEMYLSHSPDGDLIRSNEQYVSKLTQKAQDKAGQIEKLLAWLQALKGSDERELILLYSLLKQLPTLTFEPVNYTFVGRVVIPLENVLDLLIHLDTYIGGQPVRKGESPGAVELFGQASASSADPSAPLHAQYAAQEPLTGPNG
jgi:hypothetical protein